MHKSLNHKRVNDSMNFVSGTHQRNATFASLIGLSIYPFFIHTLQVQAV